MKAADYPKFAVRRADGKWLQERTVVKGFHWESPPVVWGAMCGWPRSSPGRSPDSLRLNTMACRRR